MTPPRRRPVSLDHSTLWSMDEKESQSPATRLIMVSIRFDISIVEHHKTVDSGMAWFAGLFPFVSRFWGLSLFLRAGDGGGMSFFEV